MEIITIIGTSLACGVLGGLAGYGLGTRWFHPKGGYEDHEERLALIESITRSVQRAQKSQRMRELRAATPPDSEVLPAVDGAGPPLGANLSPADAKALLRRSVFSRRAQ